MSASKEDSPSTLAVIGDSEKGLGVPLPNVDADAGIENKYADTKFPQENAAEQLKYLHGFQLNLMVAGLALATLLVFLVWPSPLNLFLGTDLIYIQDNAILATAIPTITTSFNSLDDVGWYGSAFFITVLVNPLIVRSQSISDILVQLCLPAPQRQAIPAVFPQMDIPRLPLCLRTWLAHMCHGSIE